MAVDFMKVFIAFMLLGIMLFGLFNLIDRTQTVNNVDNPVSDDNRMSNTFSQFTNNVSELSATSTKLKEAFEKENPTSGFGTILLFSIVSVGKSVTSMMMGIYNSITILPGIYLGVDPVIIGIVTSILVISLLIGVWIIYKLGG